MGKRARPIDVRFWEKVAKAGDDECWLWAGTISASGYGVLSVGSKTNGTQRLVTATHLALEFAGSPLPEGADACHRCDNPPCVNHKHLFAGSRSDNMQDALAKGRLRKPNHDRQCCRNGHEFNEANTFWVAGLKQCRACRRDASRRHYERHHAAELERASSYREANRETLNAKALQRYYAMTK